MEINKDLALYCDTYIESSELRATESHYQERCLIINMTIDGIRGLILQNADREMILRQMRLALRYYNDLKGRKIWFRQTEPVSYQYIKTFTKIFKERAKIR